jgi:hypothetical protein
VPPNGPDIAQRCLVQDVQPYSASMQNASHLAPDVNPSSPSTGLCYQGSGKLPGGRACGDISASGWTAFPSR